MNFRAFVTIIVLAAGAIGISYYANVTTPRYQPVSPSPSANPEALPPAVRPPGKIPALVPSEPRNKTGQNTSATGSICGTVILIHGAGEQFPDAPVAGATLRAYNAAGVEAGSAVSNASGEYKILGLAPGEYKVVEQKYGESKMVDVTGTECVSGDIYIPTP